MDHAAQSNDLFLFTPFLMDNKQLVPIDDD